MPSVSGYVSEDNEEEMEALIEAGKYEDQSDFVESAIRYYLYNKYNR